MDIGQHKTGGYYKMSPIERINYIYNNYYSFPARIKDYEYDLTETIREARASERRSNLGDLGVRIQTGGFIQDPTGSIVVENDIIISCIKSGRISDGLMESFGYDDEILRGIAEINLMRYEYDRFTNGLHKLKPTEYEIIHSYITYKSRLPEIARDYSITVQSANTRVFRTKKKLVASLCNVFIAYDDDSILRRCS